nr:MAG TPA: hypothetical protein [Caudoviricetes sp.]
MGAFFFILYSLLWILVIIVVLLVGQFFKAAKRTVAPTISEYGNILLFHIILNGLYYMKK